MGRARMKFNKAEVALLASQPSSKFEKEGVLFVREKQEGFFKRNEGEFEDKSQIMEAGPVKTILVLTSLPYNFSLFLFYFNSVSALDPRWERRRTQPDVCRRDGER